MLDIINVAVLSNASRLDKRYVRIVGNTILETGPMDRYRRGPGQTADREGAFLCPAFIDIHNHGAKRFDTMDARSEAFDAIARHHFSRGVGSFLFSTMTAPLDRIRAVFSALEDYSPPVPVDVLGVHVEGPYLSAGNAGAQQTEFIRAPAAEDKDFIEQYRKTIKLITVAPDIPGAADFISFCTKFGITVFGGHDNALAPEVYKAMDAGMRGVTHLYCCSSMAGRRAGDYRKYAGLTEIALTEPGLTAEVIADGWHIPRELFKLIYQCKGYERICLVSDAMRATGLIPGRYMLGAEDDGVAVDVLDGIAVLPDRSAFAGSVTPINKMVERLIGEYSVPAEHAVYMASGSQARLLGLEGKGAVEKGYEARLNILDPRGRLTELIRGEEIIQRGEENADL
ncbi:N-acetylglucosamine-6-phosphate deacetylase [Breznakiella homolactica]|uniref:Amidohydrolase family protein n=1 Tax=Breznakiella homolactica TaxID=2798577 RepID=A0A7T7XNA9_9SPIR|nr:amidohydrolase family protein [Breznakiella homolactica]QQO09505.1 amidohydrolase family protein [Breznakiella homolactica]